MKCNEKTYLVDVPFIVPIVLTLWTCGIFQQPGVFIRRFRGQDRCWNHTTCRLLGPGRWNMECGLVAEAFSSWWKMRLLQGGNSNEIEEMYIVGSFRKTLWARILSYHDQLLWHKNLLANICSFYLELRCTCTWHGFDDQFYDLVWSPSPALTKPRGIKSIQ